MPLVISVFVNWRSVLRILFYEWWSFVLHTEDIKYISHSDWWISLLSGYYFPSAGSFQCRISSFDYQWIRFLKGFIAIWWTKFQEVPCSDSISWCQSSGCYLFPDLSPNYVLLHSSHCLETFSNLGDFWGQCLLWSRSQDIFNSQILPEIYANTTIFNICLTMFNIWSIILKLREQMAPTRWTFPSVENLLP